VATIGLFFMGFPAAEVALLAGAFLLVTRRIKPELVYAEIDWSLLSLFTGLFLVVHAVQGTALFQQLPVLAARLDLSNAMALTAASAVMGNLVSNVPSVLLFKSIIPHLANPQRSWLVLAMSATLAGNLTILGSVANLIVVQKARRYVVIGFWEYSRVGVPVTVLTLLLGIFFLR
jgi:Na+/H+ antiporter NhaD/arsenite permease-like protein